MTTDTPEVVREFPQTDERYVPVENTLPSILPSITRQEAERAHNRLVRHFGRKELGSAHQLSDVRPYPVRICWISKQSTSATNHFKGWGRLIHDTSHHVFRRRHPTFRPHDGGHAVLELEMAAYVVAKGWLDGILRPSEKPKPNTAQRRRVRLLQIENNLARWASKLRRAENALRKLKRQKATLMRAIIKEGEPE